MASEAELERLYQEFVLRGGGAFTFSNVNQTPAQFYSSTAGNTLTHSQTSHTTTYAEGKVRMGARSNGNQVWTGNIPILQIYKGKGFTASDVSQNFNAQRGRFGI